MIWVMTLRGAPGGQFVVGVPKKWIVENIEPDERLLFMVEREKGCLEIHTERNWYEQKYSKDIAAKNLGAVKTRQRKSKPRDSSGAVGQHEEIRSVTADTPISGE